MFSSTWTEECYNDNGSINIMSHCERCRIKTRVCGSLLATYNQPHNTQVNSEKSYLTLFFHRSIRVCKKTHTLIPTHMEYWNSWYNCVYNTEATELRLCILKCLTVKYIEDIASFVNSFWMCMELLNETKAKIWWKNEALNSFLTNPNEETLNVCKNFVPFNLAW